MAENESAAGDESKETKAEGADTTTADETKDGGTDAGDGSNKGTEGDKADDKKADDTKKEDEPEDDDEAEPPTRSKSKESFIIDRKNRQIEKIKEKEAKDDKGGQKGGGEEEDDADLDADEVDPDDRHEISKEVSKQLAPILAKEEAAQTKAEVSDFIAKNPNFKPFEAKILKFASHESRKHLPIQSIAYEVAGPKLLKMGAEQGRAADAEAKKSQSGGGGSNRSGGSSKSVMDMTVDEFKAHQREVLSRRNSS